MNPLEWLEYEILGKSLATLLIGIAVAIFAWAVLGIVRRVLHRRLSSLAGSRKYAALHIAEQAVKQTKSWFLLLIALAIGLRFWTLAAETYALLISVVTIGLLVQVGLWATAAMGEGLRQRREMELTQRPEAIAAMDVLGFVVRLVVWTFVVLMIMDNLGVDITALVAGLGVGGIAVALATQNILGDLFASLSIVLDKPFVVGDFLSVGETAGNVEKVGLKTTRIRSLSGEQLIFSNNDLLNSRIRNFGRMFERRVVLS
ncbi:MAG: mechanosensitive ion channel domain-containing protein, partial [Woeseia sp.]